MNTFDFNTLKKSHEKGTDRQTDTRTSRLYDRIGPVGRFDEKFSRKYFRLGGNHGVGK